MTYLKAGDVISVERGMRVHAKFPEKFIYGNTKYSNELAETDIKVGEIRNNEIDIGEIRERIADGIQNAFLWNTGVNVEETLVSSFVVSVLGEHKAEIFDTGVFAGEYVVVRMEDMGGGMEQGGHYSESYCIAICKKLGNGDYDPVGLEISICDGKEIKIIRKKEMMFV